MFHLTYAHSIAVTVCIALAAGVGVFGQVTRDARALATLSVPGSSNSTPSLAAAGRTVAAVWTATRDGAANVYLSVSNDGGMTFSSPARVNDQDGDAGATNEQPPRVVISGTSNARVFTVLWSKRDTGPQQTRRDVIRVARSTDGGRTFTPARVTHDPSFGGARGWQSATVASDGTIHAVWLDGREATRKIAEHTKSSGMQHKGQPPQEIYHGRLSADGRMTETLIASDVCFCCKTAVAIGPRGTVYTAWRHIFPGSMRDIAFAASDGGRPFGPVVRVSEDKWELNGCPEDGPSMAVDGSGTIHIAWATVVNDAEPYKAIFYATSRDGKVFSPRKRLPTPVTITPGHPQLALTNNGAAIVFDEVVAGERRVSIARVTSAGAVQPTELLSRDESASHPVIARAGSEVVVAWTSRSAAAKPTDPSVIKVRRLPT